MQLLLIHSDHFKWQAKEKALKEIADLNEKSFSLNDSVLVVFSAVEKLDEKYPDKIAEKTVDAIKSAALEIKEKKIMIYPFVHLTQQPSSPRAGQKILNQIIHVFNQSPDFEVHQAPFGYYKAFELSNKGHPLAERSKRITIESSDGQDNLEQVKGDDLFSDKEDLSALKAEKASKSYFQILTQNGETIDIESYRFSKTEKALKKFVKYEIQKDRTSPEPPPHIKLMKQLELADYEPGTDPGNFRFPPRGFVLRKLIEERVEQLVIDYGAHVVKTPSFYDFEHPALKKYLARFPARQYIVQSGQKNYFMRFSACFGQFLTLSQSTISYKNLPVKIYELASSFRREQSGEISGLRRLRGFTMPDIHTLCADISMSKKAFKEQFDLSTKMLNDLELDYEIAFRIQEDFYAEHKDWILEVIQKSNKNILLELFKERYAYFILKFEFNFVDSQSKAAALSTVQIDVENAKRFDVKYIDEEGKEQYGYILHCSIPGAVERDIYAILETAAMKMQKGETPILPFWLSPVHIRLIPIGETHLNFCDRLKDKFEKANLRIEIDDRLTERVGKRIRSAEKLWTPYILVIGDKEINSNDLNVRVRGVGEQLQQVDHLISILVEKLKDYPTIRLPMPAYISKQVIFSRSV